MSSRPARRAALLSATIVVITSGWVAPTASAQDGPAGGGTPASTPAPAATAPPASPAPAVSETQTVSLTRPQVKSVQRRARVRPDGAIGAQTRTALRRYQAKKRLVKTGKPNLQTLKAMKLGFAKTIERQLVARARTTTPAQSTIAGYVSPLQGPWEFGGSATAFGDRGGAHQGVDLLSACGTPIVAASSGTVKANTSQSAAGNYVVLTNTPSGEDQTYMHLQGPSPLKVGDRVDAGAPIGAVGDTGNATACLLHFELWTAPGWYEGGQPRDPRGDLTSWAGGTSKG